MGKTHAMEFFQDSFNFDDLFCAKVTSSYLFLQVWRLKVAHFSTTLLKKREEVNKWLDKEGAVTKLT